MARVPQPSLFSWDKIDAASDMQRLVLVLSVLEDEAFMRFLEGLRGRGRDDYPIRPMWNAMIAGIVFRHPSAASLLCELRRNRELLAKSAASTRCWGRRQRRARMRSVGSWRWWSSTSTGCNG